MPDTLTPAEIAIQESDKAREEFFGAASDEFERVTSARTAAINPLGEKLPKSPSAVDQTGGNQPTPAAGQKTGATSSDGHTPRPQADASPAKSSPDTPSSPASTAKIPGPPQVPSPPTPDGAVGQKGAISPATGQPSPDDVDIPGADAFDSGPNRPQTTHWRKLHASKDQWVAKAQAAEKRIAELESRTVAPAPEVQKQLETLQQERDGLIARLEAVAVERSPRFEAHFKPRIDAAISVAKQAVGPTHAETVAKILDMPESSWRDTQIESIISELGPTSLQSMKLVQAVADLDRVKSERNAMSQQGSQLYKQWQAEEQQAMQRQQQERVQSATRVFETVVNDWKKAGADIDDNGLALARDVFMGQRDMSDIATAAMWVAVGPKAAANALKLQNRVAELEAELSRLKSATPGNASDAGSSPGSAGDDVPTDVGYGEGIARLAMQQGFLRR